MVEQRSQPNSLPLPPIAMENTAAREILRVWSSDGNAAQVVLQPTWKEPGAWGLMLVDIARHAANAYEQDGYDRDDVLRRIRAFWDAEWADPTDEPKDITRRQ
jgi:hypothetical protein